MRTKRLHITFTFSFEEWNELKLYYKESEIRQILLEGGVGELHQLMEHRLIKEKNESKE